MTMRSKQKGEALERAVAAIEHAILSSSPALKEATFRIQSRRIVTVAGVRHEIDIWVDVDLGGSYDAVFIFECKNWAKKVGKNPLIVFSEKIKAVSAQRGFFLARTFTKHAIAQARLDPRIVLLTVSELSFDSLPLPVDVVVTSWKIEHSDLTLEGSVANPRIELSSDTVVTTPGGRLTLKSVGHTLANEAAVQDLEAFQTTEMPAGRHVRTASMSTSYDDGAMLVEGLPISSLTATVRYIVDVIRPSVVSRFDVQTRGRTHTFGAVQFPDGGEVTVTLVQQSKPQLGTGSRNRPRNTRSKKRSLSGE